MRRLVRSAISATVTFTLGVAIAMFWSHVVPKKVSLSMLARNPGAYDRKVVQIEALAQSSHHLFLASIPLSFLSRDAPSLMLWPLLN